MEELFKEIDDMKAEIIKLKKRKKRFELDKKWENSGLRKICIIVLTYIVVLCYSTYVNKLDNVFLSSLLPVIGFIVSTLLLKGIRKIWESRISGNVQDNQ